MERPVGDPDHDPNERLTVHLDPKAFLADPELMLALEGKSTPLICNSECVLFVQGDPPVGLYILRKGTASLTMNSEEGKTIVSVQADQGSLLGLPGLLANQPYSLTATAKPGAKVDFIPRDEFTALMRSEPQIALKILAVLAAEVRSARHAIS
jgi:CRP-like cAMP-binding protein